MDKELIKKARQANLAQYLMGVGVPLERNGSRFKHKEHDSLVFTENAYYWNSRQEHGNAIDYLVRHMNMDFIGAVVALANIPISERMAVQQKKFELDKDSLCENPEKVKTFLRKTRFIGSNTIDFLIENGLLFQEQRTNNAIFLTLDENNNCVGAELQGTSSKRFKGVKTNSKYGYGFNVKFSNDDTFDYALFFESAIDLMSFIDYKMNHENKSLKRCILISMSGLKINIVKHSLKVFKGMFGAPEAVLCVDNDSAGQAFKTAIEREGIKYIDRAPDSNYKDWNEQLIEMKKHSRPIQRLMDRGANQGLPEMPPR